MLSTTLFMMRSKLNAAIHTDMVMHGHTPSANLTAKVSGAVKPNGKSWENQSQINEAASKAKIINEDVYLRQKEAEEKEAAAARHQAWLNKLLEDARKPVETTVENTVVEEEQKPEDNKASVIFPEEITEEVTQQTSDDPTLVVATTDEEPTEMEKALKPKPSYRRKNGKKARKAAAAAKEAAKKVG